MSAAQKVASVKMLELPQEIKYTALCQLDKTRKLGDGRFAAVAALYFGGKRGLYTTVIAESRSKALRMASDFIEGGPRALHDASYAEWARNAAYRSESRLRAMGG